MHNENLNHNSATFSVWEQMSMLCKRFTFKGKKKEKVNVDRNNSMNTHYTLETVNISLQVKSNSNNYDIAKINRLLKVQRDIYNGSIRH